MKVCPHCAEELPDEIRVCSHCGRDTTVEPVWKTSPRVSSGTDLYSPKTGPSAGLTLAGETRANKLAVTALVVVVVSQALGFYSWVLALIADGAGFLIGLVAMQQVRSSKDPGYGFGFALAAVIIGGLGLFWFLFWFLRFRIL